MPAGHYKLVLGDGATTITDDYALTIENRRPENNISSLAVQVDDYQSKSYSDLFDVHTQLDLQIKYATAGYVTTFSGLIHNLKPTINPQTGGEVLEVQAWGWGIALAKTTCNTSFGIESANPNTYTPEQIVDYIIANEVTKRWGPTGSSTQWILDTTDVDAPHADFNVTNLTSQYLDNFTLVNRLCNLINAHANITSDISVHWYVDTDKHFRMKEIDQDSVDASWKRYYGGSAANATFKEGINDVLTRGFHKHIEDYANHVVVAAGFRKPAYDVWCEDSGPTWGNFQSTDAYSTDQFLVGSHSLQVTPTVDASIALVFYPSTHNAAWNFDYVQSEKTIPHLNFYIYVENAGTPLSDGSSKVVMGKDWNGVVDASGNIDIFYYDLDELIGSAEADRWYHCSVPFGDYWKSDTPNNNAEWHVTGSPDWDDIDFVAISLNNCMIANQWYVDDLHFASKLIRSCYDTSEITATTKERQIFLRMDSAVDDTLVADDDDAGAAAMIALSELYRRKATPIIGFMEFPCIEDMLPGQTLQIYAGLKSDRTTYRWSNQPMRIKELVHRISAQGFKTTVELTSDVTNTFATGVPSMYDILMDSAGALGHGQAKDLKNSGVDNLIPVLGWDPT